MRQDILEAIHHITGIIHDMAGILGPILGALFADYIARTAHITAIRKKFIRFTLILLVLIAVGSSAYIIESAKRNPRAATLKTLRDTDPVLFRGATPDSFQIARIFSGRARLASETDLRQTLAETKASFRLCAVTGGTMVNEFRKDVLAAVGRGVSVRLMLLDPDKSNRGNFELHAQFTALSGDAMARRAIEIQAILKDLIRHIEANRPAYKGSLDVRYLRKPIVTSMWLQDAEAPDGVAHLELRLHSRYPDWPSIRVSRDARELLEILRTDYDSLWEKAYPLQR